MRAARKHGTDAWGGFLMRFSSAPCGASLHQQTRARHLSVASSFRREILGEPSPNPLQLTATRSRVTLRRNLACNNGILQHGNKPNRIEQ